jgi:hypothetical protein
MRAWFFSENAYHLLPDAREYDSIRVKLPNRYYDPKIGADLYHRFIDEWLLAEELGLEIMVNEHHQTATNVNPSAAVVMGALGRVTRSARLLILGNPIANRREPVRVAEEWRWWTCTRAGASSVASSAACRTRCPPATIAPRT